MATYTPDEIGPREAYRLLLSVVVPRPIGWVSTVAADGSRNLAPFSFFNAVGGPPPTVMVSVAERRGEQKDTLRNARETGEMVLQIVERGLAERMNRTSGEWPHGVDEFAEAELEAAPSVDVRPPRVAAAAIAMEARVTQLVPVEGTSYTMILGQVVRYHLRDDLLRENGLVDAAKLAPVARLGGDEYATLGELFEMVRPRV